MIIVLFVVLATFAFGCQVQSDVVVTVTESLSASGTNKDDDLAKFAVDNSMQKNDSLFSSVEKGMCFGSCSTYKMHIYSNETVVLKAIRVDKTGLYQSSLIRYR